jgi:hypothetical protein
MTTHEEIRCEHEGELRKLSRLQAATVRLWEVQSAPAEIVAADDAVSAWLEQSHDIIRREIEAARAERT